MGELEFGRLAGCVSHLRWQRQHAIHDGPSSVISETSTTGTHARAANAELDPEIPCGSRCEYTSKSTQCVHFEPKRELSCKPAALMKVALVSCVLTDSLSILEITPVTVAAERLIIQHSKWDVAAKPSEIYWYIRKRLHNPCPCCRVQ